MSFNIIKPNEFKQFCTKKKKKNHKKNIIWLCTCHLYNRMADIIYVCVCVCLYFSGSAVI